MSGNFAGTSSVVVRQRSAAVGTMGHEYLKPASAGPRAARFAVFALEVWAKGIPWRPGLPCPDVYGMDAFC